MHAKPLPQDRPAPPGPVSNPRLPPDEERERGRSAQEPGHSGNGIHPHRSERPPRDAVEDEP